MGAVMCGLTGSFSAAENSIQNAHTVRGLLSEIYVA